MAEMNLSTAITNQVKEKGFRTLVAQLVRRSVTETRELYDRTQIPLLRLLRQTLQRRAVTKMLPE